MTIVKVFVKRRSVTLPVGNYMSLPPGGSNEQVLKKRSQADGDTYWGNEAGSTADVNSFDPGDINLIFENKLI